MRGWGFCFAPGDGPALLEYFRKTTGITAGALTAKVRYSIEEDYDYAFIESSSDGGATFTPVVVPAA